MTGTHAKYEGAIRDAGDVHSPTALQCIGDVFLQVTEDMKTYANFLKLYSPFMQEYTEAKTDEWFAMTMKVRTHHHSVPNHSVPL